MGYKFSPLAPGIPISEGPDKTPTEVYTIWSEGEEKFSVYKGCILAFTNVENAEKYLQISLAFAPEMSKLIVCSWLQLTEVIPNPNYKTVLLDFDPVNNETGPYEVYFIR